MSFHLALRLFAFSNVFGSRMPSESSIAAGSVMQSSCLGLPPLAIASTKTRPAAGSHVDAPRRKGRKKDGEQVEEPEMSCEEGDEDVSEPTKTSHSEFQKLTIQTAKLALSAHQAAQVARSIGVDVLLIRRAMEPVSAMKKSTKAYHEFALTVPKEKKSALDPPYIGAFDALLQCCVEAATKSGKFPNELKQIDKFVQSCLSRPEEERRPYMLQSVRYCRVVPAFNKSDAKLEVAVKVSHDADPLMFGVAAGAWDAMRLIIIREFGAQQKSRVAPRTNIERKIITTLKKLGHFQDRNGGDW